MADGERRLGHADGQVIPTLGREPGQLLARLVREPHPAPAVAALHQGGQLGREAHLVWVEQLDLARLLAGSDHGPGQLAGALAPLGEGVGDGDVTGTGRQRLAGQQIQLGLAVGGEAVDGDHHGHTVTAGVLDMPGEVGAALLEGGQIFPQEARRQRLARANVQQAAVGLETAHRGHQHHAGGGDAGLAALDVEELLQPHVGAKARLGHHIVGEAQGDAIGDDGGVAVGDVGEGAGVHQYRGLLRGLHQGRLQGVFEQHRHGPRHFQLFGGDGVAAAVQRQLDAADAGAQVFQIARQRQNGHQLGGGCDDEAIGTLHPIGGATLA